MLDARQQYYLPSTLYSVLKSIYSCTVKECHEKYLLDKICGKNILFIQCNSGETFLLAMILLNLKNFFSYDKICFTHNFQKSIFDMFFHDYNYEFIQTRVLQRPMKTTYSINGKNVFCFLGRDFWEDYFLPDKHIKKSILNFLNINKKILYYIPFISDEEKLSVRRKLESSGIKVDNLIFINTSAQSMSPLPQNMITDLCNKIYNYGYDIFVNNYDYEKKYTLKEAFIIAGFAKQIISLRSGFTEILCMYEKPIHAIYTKGTLENFFEHYNLHEYEFINKNIYEYIYNDDLVNNICKNIEK